MWDAYMDFIDKEEDRAPAPKSQTNVIDVEYKEA